MLITLVINMGGWTFNEEAVADVWFDEQRSLSADDGNSMTGHQNLKADPSEHPCNHWCHAVGHFVGLLGQSASATPKFTNKFLVQQPPSIEFSFPDVLFRPPRHLA